MLSAILAVAFAVATPKQVKEPLEPGASILVDTETGEIVGIKQGASDASCRPILIYETVDGVKILTDIRCDWLPTCKPRNCDKWTKATGLPGIIEMGCNCQ